MKEYLNIFNTTLKNSILSKIKINQNKIAMSRKTQH